MSFGFKYGVPLDADFVFDMRFLPNPFWVPELKALTGADAPVADWVMGQEGATEFLDRVVDLMEPGHRGLPARGTPLRDRRHRLHRRQAPVGRDDPGGRGPAGDRARRDLRRAPRPGARVTGPVVAALGGGHGLAATLTALRYVTDEITAIVTVADDGGSSGRLRDEFGVLPPGDLRMALAALCSESEWGHTWRDVLQHRFAGDGPLGGHALGNLLIVALWELHEDPVAGLDLVARLLQAQGRVLPMAAVPLAIEADVGDLDPSDPDAVTVVRGQAQVAVTPGHGAARCASCPRTRRPTPSPSRRSAAPTGSSSARARGSPRS